MPVAISRAAISCTDGVVMSKRNEPVSVASARRGTRRSRRPAGRRGGAAAPRPRPRWPPLRVDDVDAAEAGCWRHGGRAPRRRARPASRSTSGPSRDALAASKQSTRSGSVDRVGRGHQQVEPGQRAERLGHLRRPGERRLQSAHAELAQPEREAEHAAQRVAVGVDVADRAAPLPVAGSVPDRRDRRGPVALRAGRQTVGGSRYGAPPHRRRMMRRRSWRAPRRTGRRTPGHRRSSAGAAAAAGRSAASAGRPCRPCRVRPRRPSSSRGTAGRRRRTAPVRRAAAPRRRRCGRRPAAPRCAWPGPARCPGRT